MCYGHIAYMQNYVIIETNLFIEIFSNTCDQSWFESCWIKSGNQYQYPALIWLLVHSWHTCVLQEDDLRQIFMLTMEVLQEFSRRENLNAQMSCVFQRYLALANQVLSWNFLPPNHILSRSDFFIFVCLYDFFNFKFSGKLREVMQARFMSLGAQGNARPWLKLERHKG